MITFKRWVPVVGFLLSSALAAPSFATTYVFTRLSELHFDSSAASITGVLAGDTAPTTLAVPVGDSGFTGACQKLYDKMFSVPFTYTLTVTFSEFDDPVLGPRTLFSGCSLDRVP